MPGTEYLVARLLRDKKPKKCSATVRALRRDLIAAPNVANDHAGLSSEERTTALSLLSRLCAHCPKACALAGRGEVLLLKRRA